jgi:hypothetical protein
MDELMKTLRKIQEETGATISTPVIDTNSVEGRSNKIAQDIRALRKLIVERDQLLQLNANIYTGASKIKAISISNTIRQDLKALKAHVSEFEREFANTKKVKKVTKVKKVKKGKVTGESKESKVIGESKQGKVIGESKESQGTGESKEIAGPTLAETDMTEVITLMHEHIKECERLERRVNDKDDPDLSQDEREQQLTVGLPDVDDPRFVALKVQDAKIDEGIEDIGKGVAVLKNQALAMQDAISVQELVMNEADDKVERNQAQVHSLNKRIRNVLKEQPASNVMAYIICCIVMLILVGVIVNTVLQLQPR